MVCSASIAVTLHRGIEVPARWERRFGAGVLLARLAPSVPVPCPLGRFSLDGSCESLPSSSAALAPERPLLLLPPISRAGSCHYFTMARIQDTCSHGRAYHPQLPSLSAGDGSACSPKGPVNSPGNLPRRPKSHPDSISHCLTSRPQYNPHIN